MNRADVTSMLTLAAIVWLARRGGTVFTEAQLTAQTPGMRLDVVHLGPERKPESTAVEVKSCILDYDPNQLDLYALAAPVNHLYLLTLPGVIPAEALPPGVGLLTLNCDWPLVREAGQLQPRTIENRGQWRDVLIEARPAARRELTIEAEVELLRGIASHAQRINASEITNRQYALESIIASFRSQRGQSAA